MPGEPSYAKSGGKKLQNLRPVIQKLVDLLSPEGLLAESGVYVKTSGKVSLSIEPWQDGVRVAFNEPRPNIDAVYFIHVTPAITAIQLLPKKVVLELHKFPDFSFEVES